MTWFKVDDKLHSHRKAIRAGVPAMGLWVLAGSWCADQLTDGWVPDYVAQRIDPDYIEHAAELVTAKLWLPGENDDETGWYFHQWSDEGRQPTAESVNAKRDEARERMAKLRSERAERAKNREAGSQDVRANTSRTSEEVRSTPTRPDPTRPDHKETTEEPPLLSTTATPPPDEKPKIRHDVDNVCNHLADRIEQNGSNRPTITDQWRTAARLMLDRDNRAEENIHKAIDWCQNDEFWRTNILSMPKLRKQYEQLRLKATQPIPLRRNEGPDWTAAMARAKARDAAEAAADNTDNQPLWKALTA